VIRLVATDIDGTLLVAGEPVPEENRAALREAAARGAIVALATVRIRRTAQVVVEALGLPCPLVCQGGATVHDAEGRLLHEVAIPLALAREIAAFADRHGIGLLVTADGEHRFGPDYEPGLPGLPEPQVRHRTNREAVDRPPTRIMVSGERGTELLLAAFRDAPLRMGRHFRRDGTIIDAAVTARGGTKEEGLALLCGRLGVAAEEVLAIGDSEADAGMLRWAGVGVAVAGAPESVLAAADWVAPPAAAGAVAAAVRKYVPL